MSVQKTWTQRRLDVLLKILDHVCTYRRLCLHWILVSGLRFRGSECDLLLVQTSCRPTWGLTSLHDVIQWNTWVWASVRSTPVFSIRERVRIISLFIPQRFMNLRSPQVLHVSFLSAGAPQICFRAAESKRSPNGLFVCGPSVSLFPSAGWQEAVRSELPNTAHFSLWTPLVAARDRAGCHLWLVEHEGLSETPLHVESELTLLRKWDVEDFTQQLVK